MKMNSLFVDRHGMVDETRKGRCLENNLEESASMFFPLMRIHEDSSRRGFLRVISRT